MIRNFRLRGFLEPGLNSALERSVASQESYKKFNATSSMYQPKFH